MDETDHRRLRTDYRLASNGVAHDIWNATTAHSDLCLAPIGRVGVCGQWSHRSVSFCVHSTGIAGEATQLGNSNRDLAWARDARQTVSHSSVSCALQTLGMEDARCFGCDDRCRLLTLSWSRSIGSAGFYSRLCSGARHRQWRAILYPRYGG